MSIVFTDMGDAYEHVAKLNDALRALIEAADMVAFNEDASLADSDKYYAAKDKAEELVGLRTGGEASPKDTSADLPRSYPEDMDICMGSQRWRYEGK